MRASIDRLTELERSCLRLVFRGYTSKLIAAELQLKAGQVDEAIRRARRKLDDLPRHEAARLVNQQDGAASGLSEGPQSQDPARDEPAQGLGAQSLGLDPQPPVAQEAWLKEPEGDAQPVGAQSDQATVIQPILAAFRAMLSGSSRSQRNDIDGLTAVAMISIIAACAACMVGALSSLIVMLWPSVAQ
jgi:DNA-binding CsgD family transcriptional regulator